jgi:signal transduction histidine kinase
MYLVIGGELEKPVSAIWVTSKQKAAFTPRHLEILERLGSVLTPLLHASAIESAHVKLEKERIRAESLSAQTLILESQAKAKSEFISSISHEFKTPLTSVVAFSSLLRKDESMSSRQVKQLDLIQDNAWRLERMIDDLLHVAAADSGQLSYEVKKVNIVKTVHDVCEGLKPVAISSGKRIAVRRSDAALISEVWTLYESPRWSRTSSVTPSNTRTEAPESPYRLVKSMNRLKYWFAIAGAFLKQKWNRHSIGLRGSTTNSHVAPQEPVWGLP